MTFEASPEKLLGEEVSISSLEPSSLWPDEWYLSWTNHSLSMERAALMLADTPFDGSGESNVCLFLFSQVVEFSWKYELSDLPPKPHLWTALRLRAVHERTTLDSQDRTPDFGSAPENPQNRTTAFEVDLSPNSLVVVRYRADGYAVFGEARKDIPLNLTTTVRWMSYAAIA